MNALGHYLMALLVMALLAGIIQISRRPGGAGQAEGTRSVGGCCGGSDCHRDASTHSARDS